MRESYFGETVEVLVKETEPDAFRCEIVGPGGPCVRAAITYRKL